VPAAECRGEFGAKQPRCRCFTAGIEVCTTVAQRQVQPRVRPRVASKNSAFGSAAASAGHNPLALHHAREATAALQS